MDLILYLTRHFSSVFRDMLDNIVKMNIIQQCQIYKINWMK